jgi:tol-pal system protein YbgF
MISRRPLQIIGQTACAVCLLLSPNVQAQGFREAPVRLEGAGSGAPVDITPDSSIMNRDDMTGGVVAGASGSSDSYQAMMEQRVSTLENQIRDLRGQLEQREFEVNQLKERLDKALSDIDMRLNTQTNAQGAVPPATSPQTTPSASPINDPSGTLTDADRTTQLPTQADPNAPAPSDSPTQRELGSLTKTPSGVPIAGAKDSPNAQYEAAFSQLKSGDYVTAQKSFDAFLKANPKHSLTANATYWYGETFYAQQKYEQAARIFAGSYRDFPKGPKAADSLLKLGLSLAGNDKTKEACVAFKQLKKEFAGSQASAVRRADQEMKRLACG